MKKLLALSLSIMLLVLALSSCTSTKDTTSSTANTSSQTMATLKVGVDNTYPPMEYTDDKSNTIGFDIDLAKEIAKKLNMNIEFVPTGWDGIFAALNADKFDCIISSVSMTTKRLEEFSFTKAYIANSQMIVVKPDNNSINKAEDLAGKKVGCQVSTTANESATKLKDKGIKFDLNTYDQIIQPFADMKAGRIEAIIVDEVVGQYYIGQDKANFKAAAAKLTNEPIGVCVKKTNTALRDKIQTVIDGLIADGTMKTISIKWFNSDLTSNIDTVLKELN